MEIAAVGGEGNGFWRSWGRGRRHGVGSLPLTECIGWTRVGRGCYSSAPPESCLSFPFSS